MTFSVIFIVNSKFRKTKAHLTKINKIVIPINHEMNFNERLRIPLDSGYNSKNLTILFENLVKIMITIVESSIPIVTSNAG